MRQSEITLIEAIAMLSAFAPIKISLNGIVLYNDYDSDIEIEPGVYGEVKRPLEVLTERLWQAKDYVITDIKISIVEFHHAIVDMRGRYKPLKEEEQ